jgi:glycosyltransferase involved in cell wall biosynthesis
LDEAEVEISVVIPVYNGADTIATMLGMTKDVVNTFSRDCEIIIVNDGSSDNTLEILRKEQRLDRRVRVLSYMPNMGKGHAVKRGVLESKGDIVTFIDCDMEISPAAIKECIREVRTCDLVIGSRRHQSSKIDNTFLDRSLTRKILSRMFNIFLQVTVGIKVKDSQAGIKAGNGMLLRKIFNIMSVDRYAFDAELLTIVTMLNLKIRELPIEHHKNIHKLKIREITRMFIDVLGISYRYRIKGWNREKLNQEITTIIASR